MTLRVMEGGNICCGSKMFPGKLGKEIELLTF